MMSGEATAAQIGGFLMALRVKGEVVPEIAGAVAIMRAKMLRVNAPARPCRRHRRHGRRCVGLLQRVHLHGSRGGRCRPDRRQARQPGPVVEIRCRRHPDRAQRGLRPGAGEHRGLHQRSRHRLHVRTRPPRRHAPCRTGPCRTRHPHDLQPARPALQPGQRQAGNCWGVFDPAWLVPLAEVLRDLGSETVLGRARRRAGRDDDNRHHPGGGAGKRRYPHVRADTGTVRPATGYARRPEGRRRRAQRGGPAGGVAGCPQPLPRDRAAQQRRRAGGRRPGRGHFRGHRKGGGGRSTVARPGNGWMRWSGSPTPMPPTRTDIERAP